MSGRGSTTAENSDRSDKKGASSFHDKYVALLAMLTPSIEGIVSTQSKAVAVAEDMPSSDINLCGHTLLAVIWVLCFIAYTTFAVISFVERPTVEVFSQQRASLFPKVSVTVNAVCSNPPNCGNIVILANYSSTKQCGSSNVAVTYTAAQQATNPSVTQTVDLCFTGDQAFSTETTQPLKIQGVQVEAVLNPGYTDPTLQASAFITVSTADGKLNRLTSLDSWQVKTSVLGMTVKRVEGEIVEQSLYPITLVYDGKRPNWRATTVIALAPMASVYDLSRPGTVLDVISSIGGAMSLVTATLLFLTPVVRCIFPGEEAHDVEAAVDGDVMKQVTEIK